MLQTYEAIYNGNQFLWVNQAPPKSNQNVPVVVVMNVEPPPTKLDDEIDDLLECACGAWSTGKTLDEIDREINEMRKTWERG
jgi:hypothetical protein